MLERNPAIRDNESWSAPTDEAVPGVPESAMLPRFLLAFALGILCSSSSWAQPKEATILFKDGFHLSGRVMEKSDFIVDPGSGAVVRVPASGGFMYVDDEVRRCHFPPTQVQEVLEKKNLWGDLPILNRYIPKIQGDNIPPWRLEKIDPWNPQGERIAYWNTGLGPKPVQMTQRLTIISPRHLRVDTLRYNWVQYYFTSELGPDHFRALISQYLQSKKEGKETDKRLLLINFLHLAGYTAQADRDLGLFQEEFPDHKETAQTMRDRLKKLITQNWAEDILTGHKVGQYAKTQEALPLLLDKDNLALLSDRQQTALLDLKTQMETNEGKWKQMQAALKDLVERVPPGTRKFWTDAAFAIQEDLNFDTLGRLETFLTYSQQFLRDQAEGRTPNQTVEEVLALAVSGWLQGNAAAEADPKIAKALWDARQAIQELQATDDLNLRKQNILSLVRETPLTIEAIARMIPLLPPPLPYPRDKISTEVQKMDANLPTGNASYHLQLPPGYHHQRHYPVLLLLAGVREKPEDLLARFSELAAKNGYILAAPAWHGGTGQKYQFSAREHDVLVNTLFDLRRRFQIDSDRVFLFGWEEGAEMAYDVGLSHPHLFAGILPMCGPPRFYVNKYWSNAQYLPFYVVEGDRNGSNPKRHRELFKDFFRSHYPSLYIEYKGRMSEWYTGEVPHLFSWMNNKKRHQPIKELGRYSTGVREGEEFKTMRTTDNRFYWLGSDAIMDRFLNSPADWNNGRQPATMQAFIGMGNQLEVKSKGEVAGAKIWNLVNIRTTGMNKVQLWLAPGMIDFTKPTQVRINGTYIGGPRLLAPSLAHLLEELCSTFDRQRLYYLRLDYRV